jgi:biopolymer transport protein ExbB/TolQ
MAKIGEALVATAVGLLVALPCVAAFNLFRGLVERRMHQVEMLRQATLGLLLRLKGAR